MICKKGVNNSIEIAEKHFMDVVLGLDAKKQQERQGLTTTYGEIAGKHVQYRVTTYNYTLILHNFLDFKGTGCKSK